MSEIGVPPAHISPFGAGQSAPEFDREQKRESNATKFARILAEQDSAEVNARSSANLAKPNSSAEGDKLTAPRETAAAAERAQNAKAPKAPSNQPASQARYNTEASVSDAAIAFSARPIVAPSSFNHAGQEALLVETEIGNRELADMRMKMALIAQRLDRSNPLFGDNLSLGDLAVTIRSAQVAASQAAVSSPLSALQAQRTSTAAQPANTKTAPVQVQDPRGQSPERLAASAQARPLFSAAAQTPAFAQLLASPSEYRLLIRGQKLSETEREHVMQGINSALMQLGLPFQPVNMFQPEWEG